LQAEKLQAKEEERPIRAAFLLLLSPGVLTLPLQEIIAASVNQRNDHAQKLPDAHHRPRFMS